MKRRALALLASLLLLGTLPGSTLAAYSIVDQKMESLDNKFTSAKTFAQTFMNGQTGALTAVDLYLWNSAGASVTATIRNIDPTTKVPVGASLATATKNVKDPNWYSFVFPTAVNILQNGQLAIVFTITGSCGVFGSISAKYSRGRALVWGASSWGAWQNADTDFSFRTWVHPTMPTLPPPVFATPTPAPTLPPPVFATPTPAPVVTAAPAETAQPSAPADSSASAGASDEASPDAIATADSSAIALVSPADGASAAPSGQPEAPAGNSGNSDGGLPILPILGVLVLLAAAVGGGLWFFVIRPGDDDSPAERRPR